MRVLERPEIPLHTNASENDIRGFVTKRKISGGTVSEKGRQARDVMLGLAKTCAKLKIRLFDYLGARLGIPGPQIPNLANLVREALGLFHLVNDILTIWLQIHALPGWRSAWEGGRGNFR